MATDPDALLQRYTSTLEQLATSPYDRALYTERISLAEQVGLGDELDAATLDLADHFPLTPAEWDGFLTRRRSLLPSAPVDDVEPYMNLIELYRRASRDYLSIPVLVSFSTWVISCYYTAQGLSEPPPALDDDEEDDEDVKMKPAERRIGQPDPLLNVVFSIESVRDMCHEILDIGGEHLSESAQLWTVWRDFETDLLIMEKTSVVSIPELLAPFPLTNRALPIDRPDQLIVVEELYTQRLQVPHLNIKQTFDEYSHFVTKFDNDNYDQSLPAASKLYSGAAKRSDEREIEEAKLKTANYSAQAYHEYIAWEREVKRPDVPLVKSLLKRAVKDHSDDLQLWETFVEFEWRLPEKDRELLQVGEQSIRFNPGNALLWATYFRIVEKLDRGSDGVEGLFARAIATRLFETDMDSAVTLYHARAAFHRRQVDRSGSEEEGPNIELVGLVLGVLQEGIAKTKQIHKKGDKQHRLEKFMIRVVASHVSLNSPIPNCLNLANTTPGKIPSHFEGILLQYERFQMIDEAGKVWADLTKAEPWSYATWYGRADFEIRAGRYEKAHEVYLAACSARGVDYPEYLLEPWLNFESECGTAEDLQFAIVKVKRSRKNLERRRAREAAQAGISAVGTADAQPSSNAAADAFIAAAVQAPEDGPDPTKKRERSPVDEPLNPASSKRIRTDALPVAEATPSSEPKRDREHSTVFAISSESMSEEDVANLFKDCGPIRESKVKEIGGKTYAMLEFMEKESVLAARTKDKKQINNAEIEVYIAWQSCLYVTNFPESFDKPAVEKLFEKYGVIFDTRWPSKRFKNTRRFCYVQFANPAHAQAALELNGTELEPGHKLGVFVSDPARKKSRTDTGANNRELYVSSLAKYVKEDELRKVFEPYGTIKGIRLVTDDKGECKGFAFVEYEEEASAQAALVLNNHELRKRRMAVTIAQARQTGTAKNQSNNIGSSSSSSSKLDGENRSVRVRGLVPGTEEAVVQQAFEKFGGPVDKVVYDAASGESTEAVVMFENASDVGKVLMQRDSITVDSNPVEIFAEGRQVRNAHGKHPEGSTAKKNNNNNNKGGNAGGGGGGSVPLMPRQASRGRGRVGLVGGRGGVRRGGGRGGLGGGAAGSSPASSSTTTTTTTEAGATRDDKQEEAGTGGADSRGQDAFRAMLSK